ncbi:MAG: S9 family peptidase [Caldilineaceae bacterium]|nr:S9 family peptidase [Caldilineaceae bacterium]
MAYDFARYLNIRSAHTPVLAATGTRVAFLSDITGNYGVWSVGIGAEPAQQWPRQLSFFADKVWELHGTPAANHLIAVGDVGGNERQQFYLISNYGTDAAGEAAHEIRQLTTNDAAIHRFGVWSHDGQQLYYTSNARNHVDFDLYRLDILTGTTAALHIFQGRRSIAAISPDERYLLCTEDLSSSQIELYLIDLASHTETPLTAGQPPARYDAICWCDSGIYFLTDAQHDRGALSRYDLATRTTQVICDATLAQEEGELEYFTVARDGRQAALTYNAEGYSQLYLLDLRDDSYQRLPTVPTGVISGLSFSADSSALVFDAQSPTLPRDIWWLHLADHQCRQLTYSNNAGVAPTTFVAPTLIHYPTFDDRSIPAFYFRPLQPAPSGGYPCILYVHGGPASQLRPDFDVRFQYFLGQGYAILATNVRGSSGYGRDYMQLDEVELRMDSVTDLKHAVAWLHQQPEINAQRIGIFGRSYGGFMVLAALTEYPDLFAAGVNVVGIANWVSFLERTSPWRRAHREFEYGSLTHHRAFLERISPIHKAEQIRVPLMVQAGDNDPRVPLYESEQVVERVRNAGGIVEFVHYADEGHNFSKLANRIDSFNKMADFLRAYL